MPITLTVVRTESKAQKTMQYARQNEHPLQLQLEKE